VRSIYFVFTLINRQISCYTAKTYTDKKTDFSERGLALKWVKFKCINKYTIRKNKKCKISFAYQNKYLKIKHLLKSNIHNYVIGKDQRTSYF